MQKNRYFQKGNTDSTHESGKEKQHRVEKKQTNSLCPVMKNCGGCKWLEMSYEQQLENKQKDLKKLLKPFGTLNPIIGMEHPFHYRHKVHAVFGEDRKHNIVSGTYEKKSHRIVPVDSCLLEDETADAIIVTIRGLMKSFKLRPYNEDTGYGLVRHVLIRSGYHSGEVMVVLVLVSPILPSKNNFVKALREKHPEITTVVLNVNDRNTSMILGDRETVLYGKGFIEDSLCEKTFRISAKSFYQVNPAQTEKLYSKAIEFAGLSGKEVVLDAYCGTGTIGIIASDKAKEVISVEANKAAVADARINAKNNQVKNIRFYEQDAGKFMVQLAEQQKKIDVVLMDPPRSGSDQAFLNALLHLSPSKVVYVSCNPETLARDLKFLVAKGYVMKQAVGVDLFPWTEHVETVILLSQQKADDYIEVDLDLDELDVTSAETKATYKEIHDYVLEKTGLNVTNLNIAQVKDKLGMDKRKNYNLPKSEDAKQPKCTPEKEDAIMEAFKKFGMV